MSKPKLPQLNLSFLGPPKIECDGTTVELSRRKTLAILVYLAQTGQPLRRDMLASMLWPESGQAAARAALRRELHGLNVALGEGALQTSQEVIELVQGAHLWLDITRFESLLAEAEDATPQSGRIQLLTDAVALYHGDFLSSFTLPDCPEFSEWQILQTDGLRQRCADTLTTLVGLHKDRLEFEEAISHARHWLRLDETHEPAHQELMQLYAFASHHAAALRQYEECKRILKRSLNAEPTKETQQLYAAIRARRLSHPKPKHQISAANHQSLNAGHQVQSTGNQAQNVAHRLPTGEHQSFPNNLPPQPTTFVGREHDLAEIQNLLLNDNECRLLTLLGPGGIGKTRLSLQIGQLVMDGAYASDKESDATSIYPDGVFFVGLAAISDVEYVVRSVAEAIGYQFQGNDEPHTQLANFLQNKRTLLIIDNFEHLLEGAELLSTLLLNAPDIAILATSREALNLQEEWLYPVGGLTPPAQNATPEEVLQNSAVQLFVQRARQADGAFQLSDENRNATARICRMVDGMPLGLELAAAWVQMLPVAEIADEIATNIDILASEMRNIPERHRSLRAVFEQTWQRLTPTEQDSLSRLAVFRGAFTREAAAKVVNASLPVMASLVDKSLCRQQAGQYELHELLRQFAYERLADTDRPAVQSAHSQFYGALLDAQKQHIMTAGESEMLETIDANFDNIMAAWHFLLDQLVQGQQDKNGASGQLKTYAALLSLYFGNRSMFRDGQRTFENALQRISKGTIAEDVKMNTSVHLQLALAPNALQLGQFQSVKTALTAILPQLRSLQNRLYLARAQTNIGVAHLRLGDYELANQSIAEALEIYQELDLRLEGTKALILQGLVCNRQERHKEARSYLSQVIDIYTETAYDLGLMRGLNNLGSTFASPEEIPQAEVYYKQALEIAENSGNAFWAGIILSNLGGCAQELGEYEKSLNYYEEGIKTFRPVGEVRWIAIALAESSFSRVRLGKIDDAATALTESLTKVRDYQLVADGIVALSATAFLLAHAGRSVQAVAIATHASEDERIRTDARSYCEAALAQGAETLSPSDYADAQFQGRSRPFEMMINDALGYLQSLTIL